MASWRKILFILGFFLIILGLGYFLKATYQPIPPASSRPVYYIPEPTSPIKTQAVFDLINKERGKEKLVPYQRNNTLDYTAYIRALNIVENRDFSHEATKSGMTFEKTATKAGYSYKELGENLAIGFNNPENLIKEWLLSPKHKENLLSKEFKEIGLAVVIGDEDFYRPPLITVAIFGALLLPH